MITGNCNRLIRCVQFIVLLDCRSANYSYHLRGDDDEAKWAIVSPVGDHHPMT
jgi:hypothetical protein